MDPQRFCVRWNSYKSNLQTAFPKLLTSEHFVDVTLACEKQFIKCHKIVLSACSVYFETLLVNNPCQHPIIFMKDVEFWEIKALVEFMYKGEVNVSQNQLDSLLKSAESLQIRGLSGTKQFVNFENSDDNREESVSESKSKRSKSDNEDEDEGVKRRKRKTEEDDKYVQITSVKHEDSTPKDKVQEESQNDEDMVVKEEIIDQEDYDYENTCLDPRDDVEDTEGFTQDAFYDQNNAMPGPSGMSDVCSLALNNVECVMDQDKCNMGAWTTSTRNAGKNQQRHQEHNYTNPGKEDAGSSSGSGATTAMSKPDAKSEVPVVEGGQRTRSSGVKAGSTSQHKNDTGSRQGAQPSTRASPDRPTLEPKNKSSKKDVFNRIRRSEEELRKAADMVRNGMTFQTTSDTFNIPISTIRFYMARRGILPQRRRGRGSSGVRDDDLMHPPFEIIHYRLPDIDKPL